MDIRERVFGGYFFFSIRVVRHWYRLPTEMVEAPSLETFRGQAGCGSEHSVDVPVHCREVGLDGI